MSIQAIPKSAGGAPRAKCICGDCGREEIVACRYDGSEPDRGQIIKKMNNSHNWSFVKGELFCLSCTSKKKVAPAEEPEKMPNTNQPTEPSRAQKREIMDLLEETYDTEMECYRQGDTDATLAEVLGLLPGWVAKLREEFFGPEGGNEDIKNLTEDFGVAVRELKALAQKSAAIEGKCRDAVSKIEDMAIRLEKVKKAVGPRVLQISGVK